MIGERRIREQKGRRGNNTSRSLSRRQGKGIVKWNGVQKNKRRERDRSRNRRRERKVKKQKFDSNTKSDAGMREAEWKKKKSSNYDHN